MNRRAPQSLSLTSLLGARGLRPLAYAHFATLALRCSLRSIRAWRLGASPSRLSSLRYARTSLLAPLHSRLAIGADQAAPAEAAVHSPLRRRAAVPSNLRAY